MTNFLAGIAVGLTIAFGGLGLAAAILIAWGRESVKKALGR